jgi:hypothetical protein
VRSGVTFPGLFAATKLDFCQHGSFWAARSVWTGGATSKPLEKKVRRPGEKAPHELPLARWEGIGFREEVHQGKKQLNR